MQANQQVTFLTNGGEDIRDLPLYLNPQAEHLLDWFPITMRITVMTTMAKSPRPPAPDPDLELTAEAATTLINEVRADLTRLKWFLWHGTVFRAPRTVEGITIDLETPHPNDEPSDSQNKPLKAVREVDGYPHANTGRIPNYGERRRAGEANSTTFVESTVNQVISKRMVKKQQMRWTPRSAHLLLQILKQRPRHRLSPLVPRLHPHHDRSTRPRHVASPTL